MSRWCVELICDDLTSRLAQRYFTQDDCRISMIEIRPGKQITALTSTDFDYLTAEVDVFEAAERKVRGVAGVLFVERPTRTEIRPGLVHKTDDSGSWSAGTSLARLSKVVGAELEAAGHVGSAGSGAPSSNPTGNFGHRCLLLMQTAPAAADVLNALGTPDPYWDDLWKAQEVIRKDKDKLPNWPQSEMDWFRPTATLYRHSPTMEFNFNGQRSNARNRLQRMGRDEMSLEQARQLISQTARDWLNLKLAEHGI